MDKATKAAVPGMAVQALAGEIIDALLKDEKDGGYDLTAGLFGGEFSTLVRRWAEAEWSAQTAPEAPEFQGVAKHKLDNLKAHGYAITGYAIEKPGAGPHPERGFVTAGGFVGWWRSDEQAAVVCKSEQKRLATLWGFVPKNASDQALIDVIKERDDAEEFGDKLLDLVLGSDRPEWSSAYGTDDALLQVEEKMVALERAQATPADPMDWPLPCDVTVGSGTMHKGVPLRTLVLRMQMLHDRAAPTAVAVSAEKLASLVEEMRMLAAVQEPEYPNFQIVIEEAAKALESATPALPATEDSSAGDLAEVHAEPVAVLKGAPYEPTSTMLIAAREIDPALPVDAIRAIWWAMWRTAPQAQPADALDAEPAASAAGALLEALESIVDDSDSFDYDGGPSEASMIKARAAIAAYRATPAVAHTQPADAQVRDILCKLVDQLEQKGRPRSGNAPYHAHDVPGIWDSDNGAMAGTACAWCALWARAKQIRAAMAAAQEGGNHA